MAFFSEREGDLPAQLADTVTPEFIAAVVAFIQGLANRSWLAQDFPVGCPDPDRHGAVVATNTNGFWDEALATLNFGVRDHRHLAEELAPLRILNLLEFVHDHVAEPFPDGRHDYYGHDHLRFDAKRGRHQYVQQVNDLFARYGFAFRMEANGRIVRLTAPGLASIMSVGFRTGDATLDQLLEEAVEKFKSPDPSARRDSLWKLWQAFERLKTVDNPADKKKSADQLLNNAASKAEIKAVLEEDFAKLTWIGNNFAIRHAEVGKISIDTDVDVDYFFQRMFASIWKVLKSTGRIA